MEAVEKGESRQEMHEIVKLHSVEAGKIVKNDALENDLLRRLADDERIPFNFDELQTMTEDLLQFTGRAVQQTEEFLEEVVYPLLQDNSRDFQPINASLQV